MVLFYNFINALVNQNLHDVSMVLERILGLQNADLICMGIFVLFFVYTCSYLHHFDRSYNILTLITSPLHVAAVCLLPPYFDGVDLDLSSASVIP